MALVNRLRHRIGVERPARGSRNEYGIKSQDWGTVSSGIKAWVQPSTSREVVEPTEGGALRAEYLMFTMIEDIRQNDRILFAGDTYQVLEVKNPAGNDHHLETRLLKVSVV